MNSQDTLKNYLEKNAFVTTEEARQKGISPMTLSRLCKDGELYRIEHGVYATELDWLTDGLKKHIVPCAIYPKAVVCGISALTYHNLTDEEEREVWLAVQPPQRIANPRYRLIRPTGLNYSLGVEVHKFGTRTVRIYNIEKSVVDAFKYLWEEVAYKALRRYLKRKNSDVRKLCDYGRRLKKPLDAVVSAVLADE